MKITDVCINGIHNPMGFDFSRVTVSWKVRETASRQPVRQAVRIAEDPAFRTILWEKEAEKLRAIGEKAELSLAPRTRYYVRVETDGDGGDRAEGTAFFETGKMGEPWQGRWIAPREGDGRHPLFVRRFTLPAKAVSARLYMTGLGLYEARINGKAVSDEVMAPDWTDYSRLIQAQTYDVTDWTEAGDNRIEVICGNGWYKGRLGYEGQSQVYGDRFRILAELRAVAEDGTETVIATDGQWQYRGSDFEKTDIYDGETLNRLLWAGKDNPEVPAEVIEETLTPVHDRLSLPVKVKDSLAVKEIIHTPAGETVLDLGQNFTGWMEYRADFPSGTVITLDHGEILQGGNFYNDNYRSAKAKMVYLSDGRKETVRAHFTFFGFRYVRVTGWPGEIRKEDFTGRVVYSDLESVMRFRSGNGKLNRLAMNAYWGQRSNFLDVPTDCPQRDERLGWTGDAQVFSPTACFQMDTRAFYRKYLNDLRMDQVTQDGAVANYAPNFNHAPNGSSVWGDVATFLPVTLYDFYGDREQLREALPLMRDWVGWITRKAEKAHPGKYLWDFGFHFGDWVAQDGMTPRSTKGGTEDYYIASMYYYASARKLERAEGIAGNPEEEKKARDLAEKIREAILEEYFTPAGRLASDTQTSYLLALNFGVYRDRQRLTEGLKMRLKRDRYRIRGGFVGATMMCRVLAENGMADIADSLLFQEGFPGWMHCINLGATTIWERWNSVLDDGTIGEIGMNSLNHYAFGSVMEYVYRDVAGIQGLEPGFTRVRFAPAPTWKAREMDCRFDSAAGEYRSFWRINPDGTLTVRFEVPFGCTAEAALPGTEETVALFAGVYEKTYRPARDYRLKYSMKTRPEELKDDPEAMAVIKEDLPRVWQVVTREDAEQLSVPFEELLPPAPGFTPEIMREATRRLFSIRGV